MNYGPQGIQQEGRPSEVASEKEVRLGEPQKSPRGVRGAKKAFPIFSPEDKDLEGLAWRLDGFGYARTTQNQKPLRPVSHFAHHLVCDRIFGRRPDWSKREVVDHINRNPLDNRRENLRICSVRENNLNKRSTKYHRIMDGNLSEEFPYTTKHSCGKWQAVARVNGMQKYVGLFHDRKEASDAAMKLMEDQTRKDTPAHE